ncbi:GumC family protein [Pseudooceanicola sp.]|uniref:GumC family protein n=1 Tax=Pseudooceanicola sp. TaxID=1914328 RepID=UPI0035C74E21
MARFTLDTGKARGPGRRESVGRRIAPFVAGPDAGLDVLAMLRAIRAQRWLVLGVTVLVTLTFYLVTLMQPERFSASATLMLDPREQQVVAAQEEVVSDLKLNNPILDSEVAVLRSAAMLEEAVRQIGVDRFDGIIGPVEDADTEDRVERITRVLRRGLDIRRVGDSYVIEVAVTTADPELSALVANRLSGVYIAYQLEDRRRVAEQATRWIADQVAVRRAEVAGAEAEVEAFKKSQLTRAGSTIEVLEQQVAELNQQLVLTRSDLATEQARLDQIDRLMTGPGPMAAAESQTAPHIAALRQSRGALLQEDARLASGFGARHPDRRRIATELAQIDAELVAEVRNLAAAHRSEIAVLSTREAALSHAVQRIEGRLSDISSSSLRLRHLEREAEAARATLEDLLARLGETRAQAEIQRAEARVVSPARVPLVPSAPRPKLMAAFGASLGLTLGLGAALALELISAGYVTSRELERATARPVLAVLPSDRIAQPRDILTLLRQAPHTLLAERVRQVRALLDISAGGEGARVLALLSSVPDEGKTTTALALAQSYAMSGRRALLLDLDARRSTLLADLVGAEAPGLEAGFRGTATVSEVVAEVPGAGFWIAGFGARAGLMADRLSEAELGRLVTEMKAEFDVIVIDAPPVLAVSDGLNIARVADSILYLVRHRRTSRRSVAYGLAGLAHAGLAPTGLVLSQADLDSDPDMYAADYAYGTPALSV